MAKKRTLKTLLQLRRYIKNIQMDEMLSPENIFDIDLTILDPVIYSGRYHSLGKMLGEIGDFCK